MHLNTRPLRLAAIMMAIAVCMCSRTSETYGQRVYAAIEQHSDKQALSLLGIGLLTLSQVTDTLKPIQSNSFTDSSTLYTLASVALLSGINIGSPAWQNLQFTGTDKPEATSPLTFKFSGQSGSSVVTLLSSLSLQLTNAKTLVGTPNFSNSTFLNLLNLLGANTPLEFTLTNPNIPYDGIRLTAAIPNTTLSASVGLYAHYYYAFFIVTPKINDITICSYDNPVTLTLNNTGEADISYKIYTDTTMAATGTFTNHQYVLNNLSAGIYTYYIRAEDRHTTGNVYYSAWKKITVTILPSPPHPSVSLQ